MAKLSIEELLAAGVPLEDILSRKDPSKIVIDIDLDSLSKTLSGSMKEIKDELSKNNKANSDLLIKSLQALFRKQDDLSKGKAVMPVKGLKIVRNSLNLMTDIKFIR